MTNIIKSFSYTHDKESIIQKITELADKEGKKTSVFIVDILEDYVKKHLDGNPQFTIEQFSDPNFIACPAFYRDGRTWDNYIKNSTDEEKQKLKEQIILLDKKLSMYI